MNRNKSFIWRKFSLCCRFFRANTSYYKITEKIDIASLSTNDISKLSLDKILIIMKTVTHSLKILHELKIVHGDLKPDNILIKQTTTGGYTTKLIDFDNSYFSCEPPENTEEVVGTPEYYSPELAFYIKNGDSESHRTQLTVQSDIFALGVIFCEYLIGHKPSFDKKYSYTWGGCKQ
ncbi:MAG: protein kinase [Saprospiraceae bacterium]|nr:protein kinase [Saprospiraceae bacterium]